MAKIAFINRSSIHYRKNIYMLMDKELEVDFYFGDSRPGNIKPVDESLLEHVKPHLHNITFGPFYWQKGAMKFLKSEYTDIILPGETYCLSSWALTLLAKCYGKRIYHWTHGAYGNERGFKKWLTMLRTRKVTGSFLYGNYAKDILIKYGADPSKLYVIYNSLAYDEQVDIRRTITSSDVYCRHFGNTNKNIVFIGRLTSVKKLDQILSALSVLQQKGQHYNMTFIGDGTEKSKLEQLVAELNLKNVWFYGACYDEKVLSEMLYNADVCVSPGNVGLTAMHTMTFGTPVISHNNFPMQMPEFEAIEDGITGTFFKEDDVNSLADAIERWFALDVNRDVIRQACYKVIDEKYNPHIQIETIKEVLNIR